MIPRLLLTLTLFAPPLLADSTLRTFAGTGVKGFSGDHGPATAAQLNNPYGLTRGPDRALYLCDVDNHCIRRIAPDGTISTLAGTPGKKGYAGDAGPATAALMNEPYEIRFDRADDCYVVERMNHLVRRIDMTSHLISTLAGTGQPGFAGDGGPAPRAQFNQPHSLQFSPAGDLYICDILNHRIRRIDMTTRTITTFAGTGDKKPTSDNAPLATASLFGPRALDFDPATGDAYLALREGNALYRIDMKLRTIHHVAGTGKKGFTGNGGPAKSATLSGPKGVAVAPDGRIYLADTESHSIRRIDPKTGVIDLVAGTGEKGDGPEGDPLHCRLTRPHGVFVDTDNTLFIGDSESHRILILPPR